MTSKACIQAWRIGLAFALAVLLQACGGGSDAGRTNPPIQQKGFAAQELYDPVKNPRGRVLREGDTGILFLSAVPAASNASPGNATGREHATAWFEIDGPATYDFMLEDEDLAVLAKAEVQNSSGASLLVVDTVTRNASATLVARPLRTASAFQSRRSRSGAAFHSLR